MFQEKEKNVFSNTFDPSNLEYAMVLNFFERIKSINFQN